MAPPVKPKKRIGFGFDRPVGKVANGRTATLQSAGFRGYVRDKDGAEVDIVLERGAHEVAGEVTHAEAKEEQGAR